MSLLKILAAFVLLVAVTLFPLVSCDSADNPLTPDNWDNITLSDGAFVIEVDGMRFKIPLDTFTGKKRGQAGSGMTPDEMRITIAANSLPVGHYSYLACPYYLRVRAAIDPLPDAQIISWVAYMESQGYPWPSVVPDIPC